MNFKALAFLSFLPCLSAEELVLSNGDRFVGDLLSISPETGIALASPRSPEPLAFRNNSFTSILLDGPNEADPFQTERLVLTNGDILPGNLTSLTEDKIVYEGLVGGSLSLDRTAVTTLRFGIKPQSLIYDGPAPLDGWTGNGVESWILSDDAEDGLLLVEPGQMQRDMSLGKQFRIQFHLKWQERPSVRIYFGAELGENESRDRYYIDLNSGGVQVRRERSTEPHFRMLVSLSQSEAFDDNEVEVDLRVNRLLGTLDLYLDGRLIRQMQDNAPPTTGGGVIIERKRSDNSASYITDFKVFDWDAVSQLELLESDPEPGSDSLVDAEGKRISGTVLRLERETQGSTEVTEDGTVDEEREDKPEKDEHIAPHFLLASPFSENPVKIPTERTRIIYFQKGQEVDTPSTFPKYEIDLANDGLVSARSISLTDQILTLEHSLLGTVNVPRRAVRMIRFLNKLPDDE